MVRKGRVNAAATDFQEDVWVVVGGRLLAT